jgi:hypothetical protein
MRWIYLAVIILFAAATIIFALQNFEIVTMSFLSFNARAPLALLAPSSTSWARRRAAACSRCCVDRTKGRGETSWARPELSVFSSLTEEAANG